MLLDFELRSSPCPKEARWEEEEQKALLQSDERREREREDIDQGRQRKWRE